MLPYLRLRKDLKDAYEAMTLHDVVMSIVESHQYRDQLLKVRRPFAGFSTCLLTSHLRSRRAYKYVKRQGSAKPFTTTSMR
jgi:hypothetical protein